MFSLDIFWLKDKSPGDLGNLPEPDERVEEIIESVEAGRESFPPGVGGVGQLQA
jgi:type I restriction enzyme M protein